MIKLSSADIKPLFDMVEASASVNLTDGLVVTAPATGDHIATLASDTSADIDSKVANASKAQLAWQKVDQSVRQEFLIHLSDSIKSHEATISKIITLEGGKPEKDATAEAGRASGILKKTIADNAAHENSIAVMNGAAYREIRQPVGVIGLITSYNFPLAVANWSIGPGLLAGNAIVWKPSEKTPLTAIAYKTIFDGARKSFNDSHGNEIVPADLVQILIGGREVGAALVEHAGVNMVSATGSVGMGNAIKTVLAKKSQNAKAPILELGGNNAVVISDKLSPDGLKYAAKALLHSTIFGGGQLCTCTRRLVIHEAVYDPFIGLFKGEIDQFVKGNGIANPLELSPESDTYSFAPLIDKFAFDIFQAAISKAKAEGGEIIYGGERLMSNDYPNAYYVVPALVAMPQTTQAMHDEVFAPLVYATRYSGGIQDAMRQVNAPANAGLVNGIYTQSVSEAREFGQMNEAGQTIVNGSIGTRGCMLWAASFGGNKASGVGQILDNQDPLRAFTKDSVSRYSIVPNTVELDWDSSQ